jgi:tRNA modification GTPase
VGDLDRPVAVSTLCACLDKVDLLISTARSGRLLRIGLRIAIVGRPNAGKSSLMNALLGHDRTIVTAVPGTTRDYVEERADFEGYPVVLIDTAGLRESDDPVETIGIQRSLAQAAGADEVWYVYDSAAGWTDLDREALESLDRPAIVVANKADLASSSLGIPVSALHGHGTDRLVAHARERFESQPGEGPLVNDRHLGELQAARAALTGTVETLHSTRPDDLAAVGLREALDALGRITGRSAAEDTLNRIFRDFCIGK